jgi:hypothetical protein
MDVPALRQFILQHYKGRSGRCIVCSVVALAAPCMPPLRQFSVFASVVGRSRRRKSVTVTAVVLQTAPGMASANQLSPRFGFQHHPLLYRCQLLGFHHAHPARRNCTVDMRPYYAHQGLLPTRVRRTSLGCIYNAHPGVCEAESWYDELLHHPSQHSNPKICCHILACL